MTWRLMDSYRYKIMPPFFSVPRSFAFRVIVAADNLFSAHLLQLKNSLTLLHDGSFVMIKVKSENLAPFGHLNNLSKFAVSIFLFNKTLLTWFW